MYKILVLAFREFQTSVKTKGFLITLVILPIFMGGSLFTYTLLKDKVDITAKKIHVVDNTSQLGQSIEDAAKYHNENEVLDTASGKQIKPEYVIVFETPDTLDPQKQKLALSDKVRNKEIHAFVVIGADVIHPKMDMEKASVKYYSENSFMDDIRGWLNWPINNRIKQLRVADRGLSNSEVEALFRWMDVKGMGLVEANAAGTGEDAQESNPVEAILIPYIMLMLLFMMIMMSAVPLLNSVMEEKTERIAEVLLGSVTPFQFMMGKVLGGISVSLTGASVYVIGGVFVAKQMGVADLIPMEIIPWFFAYLLLSIVMFGSVMASLGSACNDTKDAQSLQFPAMIPIILPMFVMMPILKEPLSSFATTMSLIPPFTPFLMMVRQVSPATIPTWQPIVGLVGIVLFTVLTVLAGGKIFRTMILMQGKKPKFMTLMSMLLKK